MFGELQVTRVPDMREGAYCLKSIDKHRGAANILLAEIRDGYTLVHAQLGGLRQLIFGRTEKFVVGGTGGL